MYRVVDQRVTYTLGRQLPVEADAASFLALNANYGRDATRAYFQGALIADADPATFEPLGPFHARDARRVYWRSRPLAGASPSTFTSLGFDYGRDGATIFECGARLAGVDAASFEVLDEEHARDRDAVYRLGKRIDVAPADVAVWGAYLRLGTTCFYAGRPISGSDAASFAGRGLAIASDRSHAYVGAERIAGDLDPAWATLSLAAVQALVVARTYAPRIASGDSAAMLALAKHALDSDPLDAIVWARLVPVFGGKRQAALENKAWALLDPGEEVPELVPAAHLAVASKLASGAVPRKDDAIRAQLATAMHAGLLALTNTTREQLVAEFGETLVTEAEATPSKRR